MKEFLLQVKYPDGEISSSVQPEVVIINRFGFSDCEPDVEYEVFDLSDFGHPVRLEHIPAMSAPFNHHVFISTETGEVMIEGYSPEH